jgi:predicted phage tail protein
MLAQRSPEIGKVLGLLEELSADEAIRMQYEAREKALRDDKARIRFAEKAAADMAVDQRNHEMARTMLRYNLPIDMISRYSGLSLPDIQALQGQMA